MPALYPSLIAADLLNLERIVRTLEPHCAGYHIDIMDGHYVPNLTMGPAFVNALSAVTQKSLWVHLMVDNPLMIIDCIDKSPQFVISIHIEKLSNAKYILDCSIRNGYNMGVALSPKTSLEDVASFLNPMVDHVLIMAVEPGFSGQQFIPSVRKKIDGLITIRNQKNLSFKIAIDGGITLQLFHALAQEGVDMFALGSAIFSNPEGSVAALLQFKR